MRVNSNRFRSHFTTWLLVPGVAWFISIHGCYTVVHSSKPEVQELTLADLEYRNFDLLRFDLNEDLVGSWLHRRVWSDSGEKVRMLQFERDGSVVYMENVDIPSTLIVGEFRTVSDTLVVRFGDREHLEKYFLTVHHDTLFVRNTRESRNDPFPRIADFPEYWLRETGN